MNNKEYLRGYNVGKKKKIQIGDLRSTPNSRFHLGLKKGRQEREEEILEIINNMPCYPAKEVETGNIEPFVIREHLIKQIKSKEVVGE